MLFFHVRHYVQKNVHLSFLSDITVKPFKVNELFQKVLKELSESPEKEDLWIKYLTFLDEDMKKKPEEILKILKSRKSIVIPDDAITFILEIVIAISLYDKNIILDTIDWFVFQ